MTEITAASEAAIRRDLIDVALGRRPADLLMRVGRLLDTNSALWRPFQGFGAVSFRP